MIAVQEDELQVQAADLESLTRNIQIKEDLIKVFHSFAKPGIVCASASCRASSHRIPNSLALN